MNIESIYQFLNRRPVIHVLFWTLFVLVGSFVFSYHQNFPYSFYLMNFLVHLPVFIIFTYGVVYYLVPAFLLSHRYWKFFIFLIAATVIASLVRILISRYVYYYLLIPEILYPKEWISFDIFFLNLFWILGPAIIFAMFKYYKNWMNIQALASEAESQRLASELQLLKAQLNPHFLFNTFNNLYVLALQKSDKTPAIISKMSNLFHYILYECNAVEVPVLKEIKLIDDYIQLEQLRYSDRLSIIFEKDIMNSECLIPPMLLYTFVENCFKHGCSPDPDSPWIKLRIGVSHNNFSFEASNSIPLTLRNDNEIKSGIGLTNIKRRLELIYPNNHQLELHKENGMFSIRLIIQKNCTLIPDDNA